MKTFIIFCLLAVMLNLSVQSQNWTLKQCIEYALEHNLTLQNQQLMVDNSQIQYNQAKSNLLPSLNANASSGLNFNKSQISDNTYVNGNSLGLNLGLNASVNIFNGLGNVNSIKQRSAELQAAAKDLQQRKDQIALEVASSYLTVLLDKELLSAQKVQVNITSENQKRLDYKFQSGAISKSTLLENKAQQAREQARLIELENNANFDLLVLAQSLELAVPDSFNVAIPDTPMLKAELSLLSANELFFKSFETRPEIEASKLRIESSQSAYNVAKSYMYPTLALQASLNNSYNDANPLTFGDQFKNNDMEYIGLSLQVPIFNKFQVNNQVKTAQLNVQRYKNEYEIQKKQYRETIQKAYANAKAAYASFQAYKEALMASTEAYNFAKERFENGAISIFDYNELKNKVSQSQSDYIKSIYQFIFSAKILDFYAGKAIEL